MWLVTEEGIVAQVCAGALAGGTSTTLLYPLELVYVRITVRGRGGER